MTEEPQRERRTLDYARPVRRVAGRSLGLEIASSFATLIAAVAIGTAACWFILYCSVQFGNAKDSEDVALNVAGCVFGLIAVYASVSMVRAAARAIRDPDDAPPRELGEWVKLTPAGCAVLLVLGVLMMGAGGAFVIGAVRLLMFVMHGGRPDEFWDASKTIGLSLAAIVACLLTMRQRV